MPGRLLVVSYFYPPFLSIATQRILGFTQAFRQEGWDITVICSDPQKDRFDASKLDLALLQQIPVDTVVVRVSEPWYRRGGENSGVFSLIKKVTRKIAAFIEPYDVYGSWVRKVMQVLRVMMRQTGFDAVIISVPPHSLLKVAYWVATKKKLPVALDFRDNWTNSHTTEFKSAIHGSLASRLESRAIRAAAKISAVQPNLFDYWNVSGSKGFFLPNGFVASSFPLPADVKRPDKFSIVYMGTLYAGRDPEPIYAASAKLKKRLPELGTYCSIEFVGWSYGVDHEALRAKYDVGDIISLSPPVEYSASLSLMVGADVLLLVLPAGDAQNDTVITGKVYEYLYSGNPILALVPPNGAAAKLIREHDAGWVFPPANLENVIESIASVLEHQLQTYKSGFRKPAVYRLLPELERSSVNAKFVKQIEAMMAGRMLQNAQHQG